MRPSAFKCRLRKISERTSIWRIERHNQSQNRKSFRSRQALARAAATTTSPSQSCCRSAPPSSAGSNGGCRARSHRRPDLLKIELSSAPAQRINRDTWPFGTKSLHTTGRRKQSSDRYSIGENTCSCPTCIRPPPPPSRSELNIDIRQLRRLSNVPRRRTTAPHIHPSGQPDIHKPALMRFRMSPTNGKLGVIKSLRI